MSSDIWLLHQCLLLKPQRWPSSHWDRSVGIWRRHSNPKPLAEALAAAKAIGDERYRAEALVYHSAAPRRGGSRQGLDLAGSAPPGPTRINFPPQRPGFKPAKSLNRR
jgi:hypothetical protein